MRNTSQSMVWVAKTLFILGIAMVTEIARFYCHFTFSWILNLLRPAHKIDMS